MESSAVEQQLTRDWYLVISHFDKSARNGLSGRHQYDQMLAEPFFMEHEQKVIHLVIQMSTTQSEKRKYGTRTKGPENKYRK